MKNSCDVIRDLLPLYADDACSQDSRKMVEEHLAECAECGGMLRRLQSNEIENGLQQEKQDVIEYGARKFKQRTATVGSTVSGVFMIPILACLVINLTSGSAMGWFLIVLAAMAVAASLILVPIMVPKDKLFWTFCACWASPAWFPAETGSGWLPAPCCSGWRYASCHGSCGPGRCRNGSERQTKRCW